MSEASVHSTEPGTRARGCSQTSLATAGRASTFPGADGAPSGADPPGGDRWGLQLPSGAGARLTGFARGLAQRVCPPPPREVMAPEPVPRPQRRVAVRGARSAHSPGPRPAPASRASAGALRAGSRGTRTRRAETHGAGRPPPAQTRAGSAVGACAGADGSRGSGGERAARIRPWGRGRTGEGGSSHPGQRPGACWDTCGVRQAGRRLGLGREPPQPGALPSDLAPARTCTAVPARLPASGQTPKRLGPSRVLLRSSRGPGWGSGGVARRRFRGVTWRERGGGGGGAPVSGYACLDCGGLFLAPGLREAPKGEDVGSGPGRLPRKRMPGLSGSPCPLPGVSLRAGPGILSAVEPPPLLPPKDAQRSPPTFSAGLLDRGRPPREARSRGWGCGDP